METIWDEWFNHYETLGIEPSRICKDGIVNPDIFEKEKLKILFIGKEANDWEGGDMRLLAKDGPKYIYLYNLARWGAGLLDQFPKFKKINNKKYLNQSLNRISLINLKKTSGGSSANMTSISAYAKNDKSLLQKQIKSIKPNIIITLATHDILLWLLDLEADSDKPNKTPYYSKNNNSWIIPWKHPSMRGKTAETYRKLNEFVSKCDEYMSFTR